jgi:hypothetical protein
LFPPSSLEDWLTLKYGSGQAPLPAAAVNSVRRSLRLARPWRGYGGIFDLYYNSRQQLE